MTRFHYLLAFALVTGFVILTGIVIFYQGDIPQAIEKPFYLLVGSWITNFSVVIQYFFGSSKSSADKTAIMAGKNSGMGQK